MLDSGHKVISVQLGSHRNLDTIKKYINLSLDVHVTSHV